MGGRSTAPTTPDHDEGESVPQLFAHDLAPLGDDLTVEAHLVRRAIEDATTALFERDLVLAERVIERDRRIDLIREDVDQTCITLLGQGTHAPEDVRTIITTLRLSATLERMGDLARHVAEVARGRYPEAALPVEATRIFRALGAATVRVGQDVVALLERRDVDEAHRVIRDDAELDRLHAETFRLMLAPSARPGAFSPQEIVDITLLGRYLERFGDHGTSVATRVLFLVTGEQPVLARLAAV